MRAKKSFFIMVMLAIAPLNYAWADVRCGLECSGPGYTGKWLVCPEEAEFVYDVYYCNGESWEKKMPHHWCNFAPGEGYVTATVNVTAEFVIWVHSDKRQRYYMFNDSSEFCYSCRQGYELTWEEYEPRCIPFSKNSATLSRPCLSNSNENDWCKPFATGATDGRCRTLKSSDVTQLTCATINCADGYYLWLNDKGNSQGICHSQSTAQKRCDGKCNNCDGTCVPNVVDTPTFKVNGETVTPRPKGAYQGCKCETTNTTETSPIEQQEPPKQSNVDYSCANTGGTLADNGCTCDSNKNLKQTGDKTKCECMPDTDENTYTFDTEKKECIATAVENNNGAGSGGGGGDGSGGSGGESGDDSGDGDDGESGGNADDVDQRLADAQKELDAARDAENSWANRAVSAASTAMTGLGGMQFASGIAEQRADAAAEKQMRAYITTMKCEYGGGQIVTMGNEDVTLPGGNELLEYYTEYREIAERLKQTKAALGLRSGIENEVLYDRAQTGLYQYANTGKTGGGETSLFRALTDTDSADAAAWNEQKEKSAQKIKIGAGTAATGAVGGAVGNMIINKDMYFGDKDSEK